MGLSSEGKGLLTYIKGSFSKNSELRKYNFIYTSFYNLLILTDTLYYYNHYDVVLTTPTIIRKMFVVKIKTVVKTRL